MWDILLPFFIALGTIAIWLGGTALTMSLLHKSGLHLDRPNSPTRLFVAIFSTLMLPIALPIAATWRGAQLLGLPMPHMLKESDHLAYVSAWATQRNWKKVLDTTDDVEAQAPGALLLHFHQEERNEVITVHKSEGDTPDEYVLSIYFDATRKLSLTTALLPQKRPELPGLPHWKEALTKDRGLPLQLPDSPFNGQYHFFGHMISYYGLIGRDGQEYLSWSQSHLVRNWNIFTESSAYEAPYEFDMLAIIDGHLLAQRSTKSLAQYFTRDIELLSRMRQYMLPMATRHDIRLLQHSIEQHLIAFERGRIPPSAQQKAHQFLEECLKLAQEHHPTHPIYGNIVNQITFSNYPRAGQLITPHLDEKQYGHLSRTANSIEADEEDRIKALSILQAAFSRGKLLPVLMSIAKDQRNTPELQQHVLSLWAQSHDESDIPTLRKKIDDAKRLELLAMMAVFQEHGTERDESALLPLLEHEDEDVVVVAIEALATCGTRDAMMALTTLSKRGSRAQKRASQAAMKIIATRLPQIQGGGLSLASEGEGEGGDLSIAETQDVGQVSLVKEEQK